MADDNDSTISASGWQIFSPEEDSQLGDTFYDFERAFEVSKAHNSQTGHNSSVIPCTNC